MTIEKRMCCDYETCEKSVPALDAAPDNWVYIRTRRVPFGVVKECHFCSVLHASLNQYDVEHAERDAETSEVTV